MKRKKPVTGKIINRRARFDYDIAEDLIAGIVLNGRETKALRQGSGSLRGAFISGKQNELFLTNATISNGKTFEIPEDQRTVSRKLLVSSKQRDALLAAKDQGKSIIPLEFLTSGRYIKLKIGVGKGQKRHDKRQVIKERDQMRDVRRDTLLSS